MSPGFISQLEHNYSRWILAKDIHFIYTDTFPHPWTADGWTCCHTFRCPRNSITHISLPDSFILVCKSEDIICIILIMVIFRIQYNRKKIINIIGIICKNQNNCCCKKSFSGEPCLTKTIFTVICIFYQYYHSKHGYKCHQYLTMIIKISSQATTKSKNSHSKSRYNTIFLCKAIRKI